MSVREIREHLEELYQIEVTPSLISAVTDEVMAEVTAWQQRPLESCYAVVMFDCLREDRRRRDRPEQGGLCGVRRDAHGE